MYRYAFEIKLSAIFYKEFDVVALISEKSVTKLITILVPHVQLCLIDNSVCLFI